MPKETGGGGKKKPAKGKGEPEAVVKLSSLAAVVWHRGRTPDEPSVGVWTEETSIGDTARIIIDSYSLFTNKAETAVDRIDENVNEDYLLRYGTSTPIEAEEEGAEINPVPVPLVPVYTFTLPDVNPTVADQEGGEEAIIDAPTPLIESSLSVKNSVAMLEALVACVVDSTLEIPTKQPEIANAEEVGTVSLTATNILSASSSRIRELIASRRSSLAPSDLIWLSHITGEHPLDAEEAYNLHGTLSSVQEKQVSTIGVLTMALGACIQSAEDTMQSHRSSLVRSCKLPDPRWYDLCASVSNQAEGELSPRYDRNTLVSSW